MFSHKLFNFIKAVISGNLFFDIRRLQFFILLTRNFREHQHFISHFLQVSHSIENFRFYLQVKDFFFDRLKPCGHFYAVCFKLLFYRNFKLSLILPDNVLCMLYTPMAKHNFILKSLFNFTQL